MRVIDFLQLILDLDKQTRFFYQGASDNIYAVTELVIKPESVILTTKKASAHALHQWELVTLLQSIADKTIYMQILVLNDYAAFYGIQLHESAAYIK